LGRREPAGCDFSAAAVVGGIEANRTRPVDFFVRQLLIAANIIHAAAAFGVRKLMFSVLPALSAASGAAYPRANLTYRSVRAD